MTVPHDAQPTPGWQWVREEVNGYEQYVVLKAGDKYILSPNFSHAGETYCRVSDEHAALIASAPALAEENARLRGHIQTLLDGIAEYWPNSYPPSHLETPMREARAALAPKEPENV